MTLTSTDPKMQLFWSSLEAGELEQLPIAIDYLLDLNGCEETPLVKALRWMQREQRWPFSSCFTYAWTYNHYHYDMRMDGNSFHLLPAFVFDCLPEDHYNRIERSSSDKSQSDMFYETFPDAIKALAVALEKAGVI